MSSQLSRRRLLTSSVAVVAGVGLAAPARAATRTCLPDVPGMVGDRVANEFWYEYEQRYNLNPAPEIGAAFAAIVAAVGSPAALYPLWKSDRAAGTYPGGFVDAVRPIRDPLAVISRAQLELMNEFYRFRREALADAFADCGQGVLYDPRMAEGFHVHMMNVGRDGGPPTAWHIWHATIRAMIALDISSARWTDVDRMVGLGWAAQSAAKPVTDAHNPALPAATVRRLKRDWLFRSSARTEAAFDSFPYPAA